MNLEEARRIVATEDTSDLAKALQAVALIVRHHGIADPTLLPIAGQIEDVAATLPETPATRAVEGGA